MKREYAFEDCVLSMEEGYICVRTPYGQLLHSQKDDTIPLGNILRSLPINDRDRTIIGEITITVEVGP